MMGPGGLGRWLSAATALALAASASPAVKVYLKSSWNAPPMILEALETAAMQDPEVFPDLLNMLSWHAAANPDQYPMTDKAAHDVFLWELESLVSAEGEGKNAVHRPFDTANFKASLALHVAQPKLEAAFGHYELKGVAADGDAPECENWVLWRSRAYCDAGELERDLNRAIEGNSTDTIMPPELLPFDRIILPTRRLPGQFPSPKSDLAILYLSSFSPAQASLLSVLHRHSQLADQFRAAVRYFTGPRHSNEASEARPSSLGGYGVEMVLKRTDYLALDDRETGVSSSDDSQAAFSAPNTSQQGSSGPLATLGADPWKLLETPLRPTEILDLGLRATSLILSSPDPLETLKRLSQDFPLYSAALARRYPLTADDETLAQAIYSNQASLRMPPGYNGLWINGRAMRDNELDSFSLLEIARAEKERLRALMGIGMNAQQAYAILTDEDVGAAMTEVDAMSGLVDASDRPEGGQVILWWNNIEKDKRYANWSPGVSALLRPSRPGTFQQVRQNIWNVVLVLDLSQRISMQIISQTIGTLIQRGIPFRFGLVPLIDVVDDDSVSVARVVRHALQKHGRKATIAFIADLFQAGPPKLPVDLVKQIYLHHFKDEEGDPPFSDIVAGDLEGRSYTDRVRAWATRVGALQRDGGIHGHVFFNGRHTDVTEMWTQQISQDYMVQLAYLASPAVAPEVKKVKKLANYFYDLPTTSKRRNKYIVPDATKNPLKLAKSSLSQATADSLSRSHIYAGDDFAAITAHLLVNVDTYAGQQMIRAALEAMASQPRVRLQITHIPVPSREQAVHHRFSAALHLLESAGIADYLTPADMLSIFDALQLGESAAAEAISRTLEERGQELVPNWLAQHEAGAAQHGASVLADLVGSGDVAQADAAYIIINGRQIGPVPAVAFNADDFETLYTYQLSTGVRSVVDALLEHFPVFANRGREQMSNDILHVYAVLNTAYQPSEADTLMGRSSMARRDMQDLFPGERASFSIGQGDSHLLRVFAMMDPLSEGSQKLSALLQMLADLPDAKISVMLSPALEMRELPIKRFYRYETGHRLTFDVDGRVAARGPIFQDLPEEPIFTLGMDVPSAWLVAPRRSVHDLDNLQLGVIAKRSMGTVVDINFELEYLVIDGHAKEPDGSPPRGLQLQLKDVDGRAVADTSVMANLGYFQFKARPGLLQVEIRPGSGTKIYTLDSMTDAATGDSFHGGHVGLTSLRGLTLLPKLSRKAGMESADVLASDRLVTHSASLWERLSSTVQAWLGTATTPPAAVNADINIFTVASGLLYERFASIMILSVMRHTKSTVKFWFIENFLSPSFIEFIPLLAEEYGFQYELVTYRWPSWLRAQKEKQRLIWAYKILFLDVLFPMTLDKVIFVDADQIVRTDLKELVDVDLHGRVYGYAPMGDDKPEMEGFRFWKQGYWRDALRGRPYHISALYVVDLKRFREEAAGDRLRAQYQALSQDPNSLANLDQDLPNSMQDTLPIFTLDQSWLWCETWCSQESLARAKTIDLCQNPLTKEPKLARARAIPEWDQYDQEIAAFARRSAERNQELAAVGGAMGQGIDEMASPGSQQGEEDGAERKEGSSADPMGGSHNIEAKDVEKEHLPAEAHRRDEL